MLIMPRMRSAIELPTEMVCIAGRLGSPRSPHQRHQGAVECQHQFAEPDAAVCVLSDPTITVLVSCLIG